MGRESHHFSTKDRTFLRAILGALGRQSAGDITCFVNNVGVGLQLAAAGALVLEKARVAGLGHELPDDWFSETVHP